MASRLNEKAFAIAFAVLSALIMLLMGVLGMLGIYSGPVEQMKEWHVFFSPGILGTLAGTIESAVVSLILGYAFARIYNRLI